jgi:putative acetyltransferase
MFRTHAVIMDPVTDGLCIRLEQPDDHDAVRTVHIRAFGRADEADLVDALRGDRDVILSLVAEADSMIAGHVLFSRMWVDSGAMRVAAIALAPVSVLPELQRRGVGSALIRRGLELLREAGERIVFVLGHHDYYPRFGFSTEKAAHIESPFPREFFMALELSPGALDGVQGTVMYPAAFGI